MCQPRESYNNNLNANRHLSINKVAEPNNRQIKLFGLEIPLLSFPCYLQCQTFRVNSNTGLLQQGKGNTYD